MTSDDLIAQARAKVTWGEPCSAVRAFLTSKGITAGEADAILKDLVVERIAQIRKLGVKRICLGSALLLGVGAFLFFGLENGDLEQMDYLAQRAFVGIAVVISLGGLYGLAKLIDGVFCLVRPQREGKLQSEA